MKFAAPPFREVSIELIAEANIATTIRPIILGGRSFKQIMAYEASPGLDNWDNASTSEAYKKRAAKRWNKKRITTPIKDKTINNNTAFFASFPSLTE